MFEMENDIKIQKYIAECGLMSRRAAEREIAAGLVKINGEVAEIGQRVRPTKDRVEYKGAVVAKKRGTHHTYLMLNKPTGYLTTMSDDKGRKTVADLVSDVGIRQGTDAVEHGPLVQVNMASIRSLGQDRDN